MCSEADATPRVKSMEVDDAIAPARDRVGVLINVRHRNEIAFGMNAISEI
jgi:selenocysteine lyase/cysteine desulfurase